MIQRIQTVLLLLAIVAIGLMFYFPILRLEGVTDIFYGIMGFSSETDISHLNGNNIWMLALSLLSTIFLVVAIFMYKNRTLQMNLCRLVMFLQAGTIAALFFIINGIIKQVGTDEYTLGYGIGYFLPIVCLLFTAFALSRIRKDENLVSSLDRLR